MYINTSYHITNTPNQITAAYNTWPYSLPQSQWYQKTPYYYTDHKGNIKIWNNWNPPNVINIKGGRYKGTPTRTGSYYLQNQIIY